MPRQSAYAWAAVVLGVLTVTVRTGGDETCSTCMNGFLDTDDYCNIYLEHRDESSTFGTNAVTSESFTPASGTEPGYWDFSGNSASSPKIAQSSSRALNIANNGGFSLIFAINIPDGYYTNIFTVKKADGTVVMWGRMESKSTVFSKQFGFTFGSQKTYVVQESTASYVRTIPDFVLDEWTIVSFTYVATTRQYWVRMFTPDFSYDFEYTRSWSTDPGITTDAVSIHFGDLQVAGRYFVGKIAGVMMVDRFLSREEAETIGLAMISQDTCPGCDPCKRCPAGQTTDAGLVHWLRFENGGVLNYDSITGAALGTFSGTANTDYLLEQKTIGNALKLTETGELEFNVLPNIDLGVSDWSICFFMQEIDVSGIDYPRMFGINHNTANKAFLEIRASDSFYFKGYTGSSDLSSNIFFSDSTSVPSSGALHHFAVTYNQTGHTARLYVDGRKSDVILSGTDTLEDLSMSAPLNNFKFGSGFVDSTKSSLYLDDLRIYDRVLTPQQIAALVAQSINFEKHTFAVGTANANDFVTSALERTATSSIRIATYDEVVTYLDDLDASTAVDCEASTPINRYFPASDVWVLVLRPGVVDSGGNSFDYDWIQAACNPSHELKKSHVENHGWPGWGANHVSSVYFAFYGEELLPCEACPESGCPGDTDTGGPGVVCPIGEYLDSGACVACPVGQTTESTGSTAASDCKTKHTTPAVDGTCSLYSQLRVTNKGLITYNVASREIELYSDLECTTPLNPRPTLIDTVSTAYGTMVVGTQGFDSGKNAAQNMIFDGDNRTKLGWLSGSPFAADTTGYVLKFKNTVNIGCVKWVEGGNDVSIVYQSGNNLGVNTYMGWTQFGIQVQGRNNDVESWTTISPNVAQAESRNRVYCGDSYETKINFAQRCADGTCSVTASPGSLNEGHAVDDDITHDNYVKVKNSDATTRAWLRIDLEQERDVAEIGFHQAITDSGGTRITPRYGMIHATFYVTNEEKLNAQGVFDSHVDHIRCWRPLVIDLAPQFSGRDSNLRTDRDTYSGTYQIPSSSYITLYTTNPIHPIHGDAPTYQCQGGLTRGRYVWVLANKVGVEFNFREIYVYSKEPVQCAAGSTYDGENCVSYSSGCPAGQEPDAGGSGTCTACAQGTYKNTADDTPCTSCGGGQTTAGTGSTAATDCVCSAGFFDDNGACTACTGNTYKSVAGNGPCDDCPSDSTYDTGISSDRTTAAGCACDAGHYGVPGDVHEYRIVNTDAAGTTVVFNSIQFFDANGAGVDIFAEDPSAPAAATPAPAPAPPPAPQPRYAKGNIDCDMTSCPAGYTHVTDAATCATIAASGIVTTTTDYTSGSWADWASYCFYSVQYDKILYTTSSSGDCSSSAQDMYPVCKLDSA